MFDEFLYADYENNTFDHILPHFTYVWEFAKNNQKSALLKFILILPLNFFSKELLFFTCLPSRDYIDLPATKSQVLKAFLCWTCYPPSRLNLVTSWVLNFSPLTVPILLAGIHKQYVSVKCLAQEHNIVVIFARRSPTLNQIRLDVAYLL